MKDTLIFDTADSGTILDSDNVGAYVRASDGTLITKTTDGSREALDVFTDLGQIEDAAHTTGDRGVMALAVRNDAGTPLAGDGDYIPLSVNSSGELRVESNVSVTNGHEKAEDSAHTTGDIGSYILSVRLDDINGANAALLAGTNGDYQSTFTNTKGEMYVKSTDSDGFLTTIAAATHLEDAVHASGDRGVFNLAVRNDAGVALAADGDYIPFMVDSTGALYVNNVGTGADDALANTAIVNTATSVGTTATDLVVSDLTNRKYLFVYNNGNRRIFFGDSSVTTATGFPISPGAFLETRAGAAIDAYAITPAGTQNTRILELS